MFQMEKGVLVRLCSHSGPAEELSRKDDLTPLIQCYHKLVSCTQCRLEEECCRGAYGRSPRAFPFCC
ncbi:hypothetical protein CEXT_786431 [Caerostris extrusa]|uniref:Uncharacterized protein n=1 Tax=Caerostris extrusa TaxID=172846 RepID=A0AAV4NNY3_CAEEX|nr:hypothetical protein CEXT_786431 [Caerostris extrusa]